MAKSSDHTYELLLIGGGIVAAYLITKRQRLAAPAVAYDVYGNPVGPTYGGGSLVAGGAYGAPYGPGAANTIPNIIDSVGNFIAQVSNGGLQAPTPVGLTADQQAEFQGLA